MCGITGIINFNKSPVNKALLKDMNDIIHYRGPDDEGFYYDDNNGIGFGHRRLSIIDLSPLGHQPMSNDEETLWITYNGEVYNYLEIKDELKSKGYSFKSTSDTEVIIKAYEEWGEDCVKHFNGMWAFALWDKKNNKLFCSRDRFGIKPFYYFINDNVFVFASEIKQILLHPDYKFSPNKSTIYDFLTCNPLNHSDETLYTDIKQISGSNSLILDLSKHCPQPIISQYWDIDLEKELKGLTEDEYKKLFYEKFYKSITLRLRSDVPVGSCLSGGLDSSAIVCIVNKQLKESGQPFIQKTFSSCFEDKRFDEREYITEVEKYTGVDGNHIFPCVEKLLDNLENLIWHQDGPIHSISMFAQREVFRCAKETGMTVMLDGQGGDEVLGGYHKFFWDYYVDLFKELKFLKLFSEIKLCHKELGYSYVNIFKAFYRALMPQNYKKRVYPQWLKKEFCDEYAPISKSLQLFTTQFTKSNVKNWFYILLKYSNMPTLLHYEDRNSMTSSIESRVPFLDYELVEFLFSVPTNLKIKNSVSKYLLRESLKDMMPEKIINRKDKMGFVTPDNVWLETHFKDRFLEIIESKHLQDLEIFNTVSLKAFVNEYLKSGRMIIPIWKIITLGLWLEMAYEKNT